MNSLDNILTGSTAAPEGTTETEQKVTQAATEGASQTEQATEGQETESDGEGNRVPVAALQAERAKVKRYTEQVASFEQTLKERDAAWERRIAQLTEAITPKAAQPEPTDFFTDPDKALNERLQSHLGQAFGPVQQQLIAQAQMLAGIKYGDDKVAEAEQAFINAAKSGALDPSDYQRVVGSPNRYAEAVRWHQQQQAKAEIGDDPAAFKAKLEAEIREKVLAELNGGNGQQTQQRPQAVTPSNLAAARNVGSRSGPAWSGPATLADIFDRRPLNG